MKDILLVDDEKVFLLSLVDGLHAYFGNINVLTADNGKKAMEILTTVEVDMVITDLKMPVMDGFELVAQMKKKMPGTPVLVMTALHDLTSWQRLKILGVKHVIEKPVNFQEMTAMVERMEHEGCSC